MRTISYQVCLPLPRSHSSDRTLQEREVLKSQKRKHFEICTWKVLWHKSRYVGQRLLIILPFKKTAFQTPKQFLKIVSMVLIVCTHYCFLYSKTIEYSKTIYKRAIKAYVRTSLKTNHFLVSVQPPEMHSLGHREWIGTFMLIHNYLHSFWKAPTDIHGWNGCKTAHHHPRFKEGDFEFS